MMSPVLTHTFLRILEVAESEEDDIARAHPYLLAHLAADVAEALDPINALRVKAAVAQHPQDLRVLLPVLLEDELALVVVVVFPAAAVLPALPLVLRHGGESP